MHALRFIAISSTLADRVRKTGKSPGYGLEPVLERLFEESDVRYVHVRDREAGCYDLRVERAEAAEAA